MQVLIFTCGPSTVNCWCKKTHHQLLLDKYIVVLYRRYVMMIISKKIFCLCCFDNVVKAFLRNLVSLALNAKKGRSISSSIADNVLNYLKVFYFIYCCCCYYYFYVVQWMGRTECYCYWFSWRSCQGNVNKANLNLLMWVNDVKVNPLGCANIL